MHDEPGETIATLKVQCALGMVTISETRELILELGRAITLMAEQVFRLDARTVDCDGFRLVFKEDWGT